METQDHKKPKQPGYEGQSGGVHLCGRCGWPYPKPHPSSKHRRAHKKVCGTIDGYKLDIDAQNKNQLMDGSDGENVSDDEHKTPSDKVEGDKVVERTISRRSSSGVGSRSNRSEDDMFSDAAMDFTDCPSPADASDGGIQRFYSMQRVTVNDMNNTKQSAEDVSPGEDASVLSLVEETIRDPHSAGEMTKSTAMESTDSESNNESLVVEEIRGPHSAGEVAKSTVMESTDSESNIENSEVEAITGPHSAGEISKTKAMESTDSESNIESSQKVAGSGISASLEHPAGVIVPANGSTSKSSDAMEDHGSKTGANEDVYVLAVPDGLPLHKHEIAVEDLDHKRGKVNTLEVPDSAMKTASVEYGIVHAAGEVSSDTNLTETGDSKKVCSENDVHVSADVMENKLEDVKQKPIVEENIVGEPAQLSDIIEASDSDINNNRSEVVTDFKTEDVEDEKKEEEKAIAYSESVYPECACTDAADNQKVTSHGAANTSNNVKNNTQNNILQEFNVSEVLGKELYESSLLAEHAISDMPPQVTEISDINDSNGTYNDGNIGVVQTVLDGNEMKTGGEYNEAVNAESTPGYGSSTAGSREGIHEPLEQQRILVHEKLDQSMVSGDVVVGHSLPMVDSTSGNQAGPECTSEDGLGAFPKSDYIPGSKSKMIPSDTSEAWEDAQCPLQTSGDANATCIEKFPEEASGAIQSNGSIKQHVAVSANDVLPDSSSQTDSLEGNWGSVSVLSAISETLTASDTPASNYSLASAAEENASLELKPVEGQQSESTSVEAQVGIEKEGASEIETLEQQQQKGSALQAAWSSSVSHVDNLPHAGKKNEEIIAKVTNWNADKNHTPLKTLLGEATARSRAESPIHTQMKSQTDEIPVAKNGFPKTENVILSSNNPTFESSKEEMGKEWNSPARYPVNIKTEKKAKSRPYWAPFLCCSSVNAR